MESTAAFAAVMLAAIYIQGLKRDTVPNKILSGPEMTRAKTTMLVEETALFLTYETASRIQKLCGSPTFVYDEFLLKRAASEALSFPHCFGLQVRFAMKACPNAAVLKLFHGMGLHFDASSGHEVERAMLSGIPPTHISLSAQELPGNFETLIQKGIHFNACSLHQLETFCLIVFELDDSTKSCGLRVNPGVGSGGTGKTNVGGPSASFGIWHEYFDQALAIAKKHGVAICRIHTHIGSGSDPSIWEKATNLSLNLVRRVPSAATLNLGGGFKVARNKSEKATDLQRVGSAVKLLFRDFHEETGRKIKLEIEPGTYLAANAGCLLSKVSDIVHTTPPEQTSVENSGYCFVKLDTGMTEVLRPSLYGSQHPIIPLNSIGMDEAATTSTANKYVFVGHCCESGDLFTCAPGESEVLQELSYPDLVENGTRYSRKLRIGDFVSIEGAGAYCSSMNTKNYNSFPEVSEVLLKDCRGDPQNQKIVVIRKRQTLEQILQNEVSIDA